MEFQSSLMHLDKTSPRGAIKPSTLINGSIFSYHAQVTSLHSFSDWLSMVITESQRQLERHQKKPNFKDDEMYIWISEKPSIFAEAQCKLNECSIEDLTSFELWLRSEYEKAFTSVALAQNTENKEFEELVVRKGTLSDVLTNFVAAVMLDPQQRGHINQRISSSYKNIAAFPPSRWTIN